MNNNPWNSMKQTGQNTHVVTLNGQTKTVTGASSSTSAANQAFGSQGNKATVTQTTSKKF